MENPDGYSPYLGSPLKSQSSVVSNIPDESTYQIKVEDLIKPLNWMIKLKKAKMDAIWKEYDKDRSFLLSGKEMVPMFRGYCAMELSQVESGLVDALIR